MNEFRTLSDDELLAAEGGSTSSDQSSLLTLILVFWLLSNFFPGLFGDPCCRQTT